MKYTEYLSHRITIIKRAAYHLVHKNYVEQIIAGLPNFLFSNHDHVAGSAKKARFLRKALCVRKKESQFTQSSDNKGQCCAQLFV